MEKTLEALQSARLKLYHQLAELGDFRPGTISVNYRKCGKNNCLCAQPSHLGHGPQYLWNATVKGKSVAKNLRLGPELEKARQQAENYQASLQLTRRIIEVNDKICELRPTLEIEDEEELDRLKKKLQKQFSRKSRKK
jgi:hypothetical protein